MTTNQSTLHMKDRETSTVCRCNSLFGERTLHPLASVIDLRKPCHEHRLRLDCYAVMLADSLPCGGCGEPCSCDYADAAVLFAPPGRHIETEGPTDGRLLLFHPDLLCLEELSRKMPSYTFFEYGKDEVLRLSLREKRQAERCIDFIDEELHWGIDRFSHTLLCNKIELLLNYCLRYYSRQFTLRHDMSLDDIRRLTRKLDEYLCSGRAATEGLPSPALVAQWAGHSEAYTQDMLRAETGHTTAEYVEKRRLDVAKQMLIGTATAISEIAARLAFPSAAAFSRLFERCAGCSPTDYRRH